MLLLSTGAARADEPHAGGAAGDRGADAQRDTPRDEAANRTKDAAKDAFGEGLRLLRDGRWRDAEVRFRESLTLVRRQSTEYDLAFVLYMQHRRRESLAVLAQLLQPVEEEEVDPRYQHYGALLRVRVQAELSTLRVLVTPETALVRIDGETPMGRGSERWLVVEPGNHAVEISAPGYVSKRVVFAARAGTDVEREISLERVPSGVPPPVMATSHDARADSGSSFMSTFAPWIVMGVGGTLLVTATVTGVLAKEADDDLTKGCPTNKNCPRSLEGLHDRVVTLGRTTDVLLVSGGLLVAGGLTWRLLVPAPKSSGSHAGFLTVGGRF